MQWSRRLVGLGLGPAWTHPWYSHHQCSFIGSPKRIGCHPKSHCTVVLESFCPNPTAKISKNTKVIDIEHQTGYCLVLYIYHFCIFGVRLSHISLIYAAAPKQRGNWTVTWLPHHPNNESRLATSVSMALRHWCCVLLVYSGVCSSYVGVLQVSIGFSGFLSIFVGGETYIQFSHQNMTHAGCWKRCGSSQTSGQISESWLELVAVRPPWTVHRKMKNSCWNMWSCQEAAGPVS